MAVQTSIPFNTIYPPIISNHWALLPPHIIQSVPIFFYPIDTQTPPLFLNTRGLWNCDSSPNIKLYFETTKLQNHKTTVVYQSVAVWKRKFDWLPHETNQGWQRKAVINKETIIGCAGKRPGFSDRHLCVTNSIAFFVSLGLKEEPKGNGPRTGGTPRKRIPLQTHRHQIRPPSALHSWHSTPRVEHVLSKCDFCWERAYFGINRRDLDFMLMFIVAWQVLKFF